MYGRSFVGFLGSMFVLFISIVSPFIRELQLYLFFSSSILLLFYDLHYFPWEYWD